VVRVPAALGQEEVHRLVGLFRQRFEARDASRDLRDSRELAQRAEYLNRRYFSGRLVFSRIEYADNQRSRYGCCNVRARTIRISSRIRSLPEWVRDYVIIHELAHLEVPHHGKEFRGLIAQYRLHQKAHGFLQGLEHALRAGASR
jgi:predicted metal-dependent hydrolase